MNTPSKRNFFNSKRVELLPVLLPIILCLCSWTIHKIVHKDERKHINKVICQYSEFNPFKEKFLKEWEENKKNETEIKSSSIESEEMISDSTLIYNQRSNKLPQFQPTSINFNQNYLRNSTEVIGLIGNTDEQAKDTDPSDNIFNVHLENINKNSTYTLTYDLNGYSDMNSVTRSINGSFAVGGYIKYKKTTGWNKISEKIDPSLLKNGVNVMLFNALHLGDYYQIKNVRIIENKAPLNKSYELISKFYKDGVFYIRGFLNNDSNIEFLEIAGNKVNLHGNEFEFLSHKIKEKEVEVKFVQNDGSVIKQLAIGETDNKSSITEINSYNELGQNILEKDATGILKGLREIDLPPVDISTTNISGSDYSGFHFLNQTSQEVSVRLPYDETKIPKGFHENDITVTTFDFEQRKWLSVKIDSVNSAKKYILIHTSLKSANYVAGLTKQPESPEAGSNAPTTFNDSPIANPASKINLISPPTANQQGSANLQYPIEIPAGVNGFQPNVTLSYNSDNKSGWAGTGWDFPVETIDVDTRWGLPIFAIDKESEIYVIGGEQLVFKDDYLPNKVPYLELREGDRQFYFRTGVKEGSYIKRKGASTAGYTWEILDGSGAKKEYLDKLTDNPSNNVSGNVVRWFLTKVTDRFGNTITYNYSDSYEGGGKNKYLSKITYNNNTTIDFENEGGVRQDMTFNYKSGVKIADVKILNKITVKRAGINIREYVLNNTTLGQFSKRLLSEIIQKDGSGNVFNRHVLRYNTNVSIFDKNPTKTYATPQDVSDVGSFSGANTTFINGTYSRNKNIRGSINFGWGFCLGGGTNKKGTIGITGSYDDNRAYGKNQLLDLDGDGMLDKAFYSSDGVIRFRKNAKTGFSNVYSSLGLPGETPISKHNVYNRSIGLEYAFKKGVVGASYAWSDSNSPTYFSDVNGDGLLDIINYGEVFFSKIKNGVPQFKSQPPSSTINVTEETPNAILEGAPAVQDTIQNNTFASSLAHIVRMWEAPVSGDIQMSNDISLSQNSQDGVSIWIEKGGMTKANEDNSGYIAPNSTTVSSTVTLNSQGQQENLNANIQVQKGQRIFIVASAKTNPDGDKVNVDTKIQYTNVPGVSNLDLKDANNNYYYKFNASTHYLPSDKKDNAVGDKAKVSISWNTLTNETFTDDVDFKIYKKIQSVSDTTGVVQPSAISLIYHHKLPKGTSLSSVTPASNLIANSDISNLLVNQNPIDSTMTAFHFDVTSDTNVSWEKIKWRPSLEVMSATDTTSVKALVQYNPYSERLINTLPKNFMKYLYYPICDDNCPPPYYCRAISSFYLFPDFNGNSTQNNYTINLNSPHNTKVTFSLKIRDANGNVYTTKSTVDVVNNVMQIPKIDICAFFATIPLSYNELYQLPFYFEISSSDYEVAKKLSFVNPYIINSAFIGNPTLANTEHKADYFAYRSDNNYYNLNTGLVYQGWGGFSYNGSKYPNETIKESKFNDNSFSSLPQPGGISPCDPSAPDFVTCMTNLINQQNNNRYFTPLQLNPENQAYISPLESVELTGDYMIPFMLGVSSTSQTINQTPVFAVPNPRGIIMRSKSDGLHLFASGSITPWLGISGHGGLSNDKTADYFQDFNGDGYPDIISGGYYQKTNLLGQLSVVSSISKKEIKNRGYILGAGLGGSPAASKFSNNSDVFFYFGGEKDMHTGSSSFSLGVGLNVMIGKAWVQGNGVWSDINGDGLTDFISEGSSYINTGNGFVNDSYSWDVSDITKSDSFALSGGGGFSMANGSWAGGIGLSKSTSTAKTGLIDVNGDGLADKIVKNGNSYDVLINRGTAFVSGNNFNKDFSLDNKQSSSGFNLYGTLCFCWGLKICFSVGGSTDKAVSKQEVDLRDFDGDGYPDLLVSNSDTELTYYHNNLAQANLLLIVENPLKGAIQLNYNNVNQKDNLSTLVGGTYQMPFTKTVLSQVTLWNFRPIDATVPFTNDVFDPQSVKPFESYAFEYEKGVQDRREREFLGFGIVKTKVINNNLSTPGVHQTSVTEFETNYTGNENDFFVNYNDTRVRQYFYKKGLVRSTYLLDNQNRKRAETKYNYRYFDQVSNTGYQLTESQAEPVYKDVGRIIPFLYKTESIATEYSGTNSHTKTTISTIDSYDKYGNATQHTDRGTSMSNTSDDVKSNITYHPPGVKNIVNIPSEQTVTANGQIVRKNTTILDAAQNIKNIKKFLGTQTAEFDMEYDTYGNLTKVTQPVSGNNQRMSYTYVYDPVYHTYLTSTEDAYNYTSSIQYDSNYLFGVPIKVTDINGVSAYYNYDSFGRFTQYRSPVDNDWTIKLYYYPSDIIPVAITERKAPEVNGIAPTLNYFSSLFTDAWGENLMVKKLFKKENNTYHFANNVYQIKDKLGRPIKTILRDKITQGSNIMNSLRIFDDYLTSEDQTAQIYTTTQYDELDRPIIITQNSVATNNNTQNLISKIYYEFGSDRNGSTQFATRTVSPEGNTTVSYTDEKGRITSSKQTDGSSNLWTSYEYDLLNQLTQMKDAGNNPTIYQYDMLGRNISMQQPDAGLMTFQYDPSGKLTSSQNAVLQSQGQNILYSYNYDQLVAIQYPDHKVSYDYGQVGAGDYSVGRLVKQTDRTGTQTFKYSSLGQVKENTRIVVAPNNVPKMFKTSFVYDVFSRINKIVYPDTEEVYYHYNTTGLLDRIENKLPAETKIYPIISNITYDNRDRMTSYLAANNTKTLYNYDPWDRMKELSLLYNNGNNIRTNQYAFDGNNNISIIKGTTPMTGNYPTMSLGVSTDKTFKYDTFGRIESVLIAAYGNEISKYYTLNMKYNTAGNIAVKDYGLKTYTNGLCEYPNNEGDAGEYEYNYPSHPNAVSNINYTKFKPFSSPLDCGKEPRTDPTTNGGERFKYDANGNLTYIDEEYIADGSFSGFRQLFWDVQNRLKAVVTQKQNFNHYVYDAAGDRILKNDAVSKKLYVNGNNPDETTQMGAYTYYPSGYLVLNEKTMSKHYYMGTQRIATRVSQIPSHRFKINLGGEYSDLANALLEEVHDLVIQAGLPPEVWVQNEDSQGTYNPPVSTTNDENTCAYIIEQQLIAFEQDHNIKCFEKLKEQYANALANGDSLCNLWSNFLQDECMVGYTPPEIVKSEMYWIHPDHLGGTSVLVNSGGKVTNWYEYMPYGEILMDLNNQDYNNPYKHSGRELDMATGYYYYGARYYDPKRSFMLSVDPLVELTMSPYAYVWNDPVNYIDPTGMYGERVGGDPPGDPKKRSWVSRAVDWLFGIDRGYKSNSRLKVNNNLQVGIPTKMSEEEYRNTSWDSGDTHYEQVTSNTLITRKIGANNESPKYRFILPQNFGGWSQDDSGSDGLIWKGCLSCHSDNGAFTYAVHNSQENNAGQMLSAILQAVFMVKTAPGGVAVEAEEATLEVSKIHFMQSSIKNNTGEYTVLGNAEALANGSLNPDILRMNVWKDASGKVWTLDHRRLAAFRLSGLNEAPIKWASPSVVKKSMWKMRTINGGKSVKLRSTNIIIK